MASNDELSDIPELSRIDSTSETFTDKNHKTRDKVVRHNVRMIINSTKFYSRESVGKTNLRNRKRRPE